jgi:hypothetical protein
MNRLKLILSIVTGTIGVASITWILAINFLHTSKIQSDSVDNFDRSKISNSPDRKSRLNQHRKSRAEMANSSLVGEAKSNRLEATSNAHGSDRDTQFQSAIEIVSSSGDFRPLSSFFDSLSQKDRFRYFDKVPSIFSNLGPKHDIAEKMAILAKLNVSASDIFTLRSRILQMEAKERYDEMKEAGVLKALTDKEFAMVCGKIATSRIEKAFSAAEDGGSESAMRSAASAVARSAIAGGTMEASKAIGGLPAGIVRDEAVADLVLFLRRTNSIDEAKPWEALIIDDKARKRIHGRK